MTSSPNQREYEAKKKELENAPKFRKYIIELIEYDEALKTKSQLTWETFKHSKAQKKWREKKHQKNNEENNDTST